MMVAPPSTWYLLPIKHQYPMLRSLSKSYAQETGVCNEWLLLRENRGWAGNNDQFSALEGNLQLLINVSNRNSPLDIVEAIQEGTGQNVTFREIEINSHQTQTNVFSEKVSAKRISKTVHLSPNVKSLVIDTGVPSAVIQHLARELYGHDEMKSPNCEIPAGSYTKCSSLERIKIFRSYGTIKFQ